MKYKRITTSAIACAALLVATMTAATTSAQGVLGNAGFENPVVLPAAEVPGVGAPWTQFGNNVFTLSSVVGPPNTGDNFLKLFGNFDSGVFQQFAATPGQIWNGGVWMYNPTGGDQLANEQVGAVNIEWMQADGTTNSAITPFISNGTFDSSSPTDRWTLQTITGAAPADAAFARLTLITGSSMGGAGGGAPRFDDAFFEVIPEPGSAALLGLGALGLIARRRRS